MMKTKWEYMVARTKEEAEAGNFWGSFENKEEAQIYAERLSPEAVVLEVENISR